MSGKENTDVIEGTEAQEDLGKRGGSRKRNRKAQRGESQGESDWAEIVHSLGLPKGSSREGLLTGEVHQDAGQDF